MLYRPFRVLAAVTALTGLGLVAGCTTSTGTGTTAVTGVEKPDITVAAVPTTDSTGFFIAMHEGLFAAQGLHVTYQPAASGERVINEQAKGLVDISAGNYVSYIEAQQNWNHGMRAKNLFDPTSTQIAADVDIIDEASVMQPNFVGLFALPGSHIARPTDLIGKTVGLNAPGNVAYLLTAEYLIENGLNPKKVNYKYFPFPHMEQVLLQQQVDVAFLAEPFVTVAEQTAGVPEITNLDQGANTAFPIEGYMVTKQWAAKYPKTLAAFQRALEQGQQIADTDRHAAEQAMETLNGPQDGQVPPEIGAVMTYESYPLGAVNKVRLQRVADEMFQLGLIGKRFNVNQIIG